MVSSLLLLGSILPIFVTAAQEDDRKEETPGQNSGDIPFNDVTFPFREYPATVLYYDGRYPLALRYFNFRDTGVGSCNHMNGIFHCKKYGGHNQCYGFAIYAHDRYMHIENTEKTSPQWANGDYFTKDLEMKSEDHFYAFFSSLHTGAYIRFGRYDDHEGPEGVHSVVFVSCDANGAWVYECNMDKMCGIYYTYYPYSKLVTRYDYIANYVNHTFQDTPVYEDAQYHRISCKNCNGYIRQEHHFEDGADGCSLCQTEK